MNTNKQVILITEKKENNSQKKALYTSANAIYSNVFQINNRSSFLINFIKWSKKILKWYIGAQLVLNNDIKLIIIDKAKQQKFAKYLQNNFYKSAKIVHLYTSGSIAKNTDFIIVSNLISNKIPKKYFSKCIFYSGMLCNKVNEEYIKIGVIDYIKQPILWANISDSKLKKKICEKDAKEFSHAVINFAKESNSFVFISINVKSAKVANTIKKILSDNVSCYIFDFSISKNMNAYYNFLYKAEYIVNLGIDIELLSGLTYLKKYLYVLVTDKQREKQSLFCRDIISKNVFLFRDQIPTPQKKSLPINDAELVLNKINLLI